MISIGKTNQDFRQELGIKIKKLRLSQNLSRETLAEKSGISEFTLRKFEEGGGNVGIEIFIALCVALDRTEDLEALLKEPEIPTPEAFENRKRKRGMR